MRLPEQRLYDWLRRKIGHRAFLERIENRVKRDTPDLYACWVGTAGWIELKVLDEFPKREKTPVRLQHWTSGQRYWAMRHATNGGRTWLLLQVGPEVFLVNAALAARHCDQWTQADWRRYTRVLDMQNTWVDQILAALESAVV